MKKQWLPSILIACVFSLVAYQPSVEGLAGNLDHPSLSLPKGFDAETREQVTKVIAAKDFKFLGGFFVNAATTLRYGGDTRSLNTFLSQLVACPQIKVVVSIDEGQFFSSGETWQLFHTAWGEAHQFQVTINAKSENYDAKALSLPKGATQIAPPRIAPKDSK